MKIDADRCDFESALARETNDCAVRAIAIATQTDYSVVRSLLRRHGRKDGRGTEHGQTIAALRELGYMAVLPVSGRELVPTNYDPHCAIEIRPPGGRKSITFRSVVDLLDKDAAYMILSNAHIAAAVHGKIEDWSAGRLFRVVAIWKIIKRDTA